MDPERQHSVLVTSGDLGPDSPILTITFCVILHQGLNFSEPLVFTPGGAALYGRGNLLPKHPVCFP